MKTFELAFEPEGPQEENYTDAARDLLHWFAEHESEVLSAMLEAVLAQYPEIRERYLGFTTELAPMLPEATSLADLAKLIDLNCVYAAILEWIAQNDARTQATKKETAKKKGPAAPETKPSPWRRFDSPAIRRLLRFPADSARHAVERGVPTSRLAQALERYDERTTTGVISRQCARGAYFSILSDCVQAAPFPTMHGSGAPTCAGKLKRDATERTQARDESSERADGVDGRGNRTRSSKAWCRGDADVDCGVHWMHGKR